MTFRVLPVLDMKGGHAVHAIKGQRDTYAPVTCDWCKDGDIISLINGYKSIFWLNDLYIADLDAIMAKKPSEQLYPQIIKATPGKTMIDAGVTSIETFARLEPFGFDEIILGTESVMQASLFGDIIHQNPRATIISLDVKADKVLSPTKQFSGVNIKKAFQVIEALEPAAIIFLDLSGVGAGTGINPVANELARNARIPLYLGGGVRSIADIMDARDAGFSGVLVATALQAMRILPADLARIMH
jgi:phosphoribosylformimino-5-aminoimidazole carboxamide ribotide isomerase